MASIPGAKNETIEVLTGILNKFKKGASSDEQTEGAVSVHLNNCSDDFLKIFYKENFCSISLDWIVSFLLFDGYKK